MSLKLKNMVVATAGALFFGFGTNAMADSSDDIVQALIAKGILTEEEGELLMKGRAGEKEMKEKKEKKHWTNSVNIRGYVQTRNTTMIDGDKGVNLWTDRSVGDATSFGGDKNFLIRRARIIFSGNVGDHLGFYIQPDFASSAGTTNNVAQLRDAYGDIFIDKEKVHRIRVGQSKVPYGFENMQSSQNRLALDRADALNSAVRDERDLGVFYYYTPETTQKLFEEIAKAGLKHSGNYGMFALGAYNGQGANRAEANDNYHLVARATYPWKTESGQIYEIGVQGYKGQYVATTGAYRTSLNRTQARALNVTQPGFSATGAAPAIAAGCSSVATTAQQSQGIKSVCTPRFANGNSNIEDARAGISFMMYPQPFGLQAEWNWGKTPGLNMASNIIEEKSLNGGYVQAMYKIDDFYKGTLIPFIKWQYFDGANKAELNAPVNHVNDWEYGLEWQIAPEVELTAVYHVMNRNNLVTGASNTTLNKQDYATFKADALRVQLQYNF